MSNNTITLRSVYKVKTVRFQPGKQANGQNYPFVKPVQQDASGESIMLMSDAERNSPESAYFIPEDMEIVVTEGTVFDLDNPLDKNKWESIKDSELIVPMRGARDKNGDLIIDGNKRRYGLAEFYVDIPGEESQQSISKKKLIHTAQQYIFDDSDEGRITKCKLLGKIMRNAPSSDVTDYLLQKSEKNPSQVIEIYTSPDSAVRILIIDAKDRGIIRKNGGLFMYAENSLGQTDDSILAFLKTPANIRLLEAIRNETYPEMVRAIDTIVKDTETDKEKPKVKKDKE